MISERLLKKWRKEALKEIKPDATTPFEAPRAVLQKRILNMTQELLDLHLLQKAKK